MLYASHGNVALWKFYVFLSIFMSLVERVLRRRSYFFIDRLRLRRTPPFQGLVHKRKIDTQVKKKLTTSQRITLTERNASMKYHEAC